jgi:hypothetical protein
VHDVAGHWRLLTSGAAAALSLREHRRHLAGLAVEMARQLVRAPLWASSHPRCADEGPLPRAALSNEKLRALGIAMPPWQDTVARYLHTLGPPPSGG